MLSPDVADEATHEKTLFCAAFTLKIRSDLKGKLEQ